MMNTIKIDRDKLLERLKSNRKEHIRKHKKALKDYKKTYIKVLSENLKLAGKGDDFTEISKINLPIPESHENDYDEVIEKLSFSMKKRIRITDTEFRQYILDKWGWQGSFSALNSCYSSSSSSSSSSLSSSSMSSGISY